METPDIGLIWANFNDFNWVEYTLLLLAGFRDLNF